MAEQPEPPQIRASVYQFVRVVICFGIVTVLSHAATLIRRPYLQNQGEDHVSILWSARENSPATLQYSADKSYSQSVPARVRVFPGSATGMGYTYYQYQADLTGLTRGTEYSYRVMMDGQNQTSDPSYRFQTSGPGPFTFLVFGDSGTGSSGQQEIALRMASEQPAMALHVGDVSQYEGQFSDYEAYFFEFYWTLMRQVPFFTAPGNHDYKMLGAQAYLSMTAPPLATVPAPDAGRYYSFDRGDIHFVAIDTNLFEDEIAARRMVAWVEKDLAASRAAWRIPYFHHLPYPIEHHVGDPNSDAARRQLVPIFEKYGVQLVFSGHEHTYQRTKPMRGGVPVSSGPGIVYMVSGGAGGTLHPVVPMDFLARAEALHHYLRVEADASSITIHAIGTDGKEFDRYTLVRPTLASGTPVVNAASSLPGVAPGGLISIYGTGLAAATEQASGSSFPLALSGSMVTVNDQLAPLLFASSGQINAQLPIGIRGPATLRVTTANGSAETVIDVSDAAPAIFAGGVRHANGSQVTNSSPAKPGEALVVYLTGLGQVDGSLATGQTAPMTSLLNVLAPVQVEFGSRVVKPFFAGLTPGFIGVYQVNVNVPADLEAQTCPLRVSVGANVSNTANVAVQR